jgi:phosphohistidine phosphatase
VRRKIFFVRHGESADKQHGQTDFDRVLTHKGKISIELLGKFFKEGKIKVNSILSSPSARTSETALILSKAIRFSIHDVEFESSLYNGTDQNYLNVTHNSSPGLIVVGHNPAISYVVGKLTGDYSISLHPGQCAVIEFSSVEESNSMGKLVQLIGPFHE